jgi:DAK2 domain fusion protein YloV
MKLAYLDGPELRGALIAACDHVQEQRAELNRINVFPVPDGDTGTNFALTTRSIADRLRAHTDPSLGAVAREAAEAGILGARGNCGMILSHYLLGFSESVGDRAALSVPELVQALRYATDHVYRALESPVEGTILTVMRETAEEAESRTFANFPILFRRLLRRAYDALARTPDLLPVLRTAGVVDAGAKGFVHLLEGIAAYVSGDPIVALSEVASGYDGASATRAAGAPELARPDAAVLCAPNGPAASATMAAALAEYPTESERYRYCTEALVRGPALPDGDTVRAALRERGDSLVVIRTGDLLKIHIHTDAPEELFAYLRTLGELATHKAEDMHAQHAALVRGGGHLQLARRPVVVVTDTACDLPEEVVRAHGIHLVPLSLVFENEVLRDRVDISADVFARRLLAGEHPTTSQPTPAAFLEAYENAAEEGEAIVAVTLSGALSGTLTSAEAAARRFQPGMAGNAPRGGSGREVGRADPPGASGGGAGAGAGGATSGRAAVHVVDSRGATLLQGLLALRAAELGALGLTPPEIAAELARIRENSGLFFTVDVFDNLLASGRVGRGRAILGSLLDIKPILAMDDVGRVTPLARVRGRKQLLPRVMELLEERVPPGSGRVRFGVVHVACEEVLEEIATELRARYGAETEVLTGPASPVLATHVGPGAWGLAYLHAGPGSKV